jgi:hypothetical protein
MYSCKPSSVNLNEEHRPRLCLRTERVLWRIYGTNRNEMRVSWRKQNTEEIINVYGLLCSKY